VPCGVYWLTPELKAKKKPTKISASAAVRSSPAAAI
jgi:hypothetical protein